MEKTADIAASRIKIIAVESGSTKVNFEITPRGIGGGRTSLEALDALQEAFRQGVNAGGLLGQLTLVTIEAAPVPSPRPLRLKELEQQPRE
jgi:hypothetical protein